MKANAVPVLALFEKKMRLEVPLFQRQYVWKEEEHWEPLWEDISRKFTEFLTGRKDAPIHFLGAMVLDQKFTPTTHVEKRQVIDGQQRLTTLQIFLAVLRDFCREQQCEELAKEFESFTLNKGMMADPETDKFKVWPTQVDREHFRDVIGAGSRHAVEARYPLTRKKYARKFDSRPRIVEAYVFFSDRIREYFLGTEHDVAVPSDSPLAARIEEAFQALKSALQVVAIDLEKDDDAQVIFETLNARGEPLLPADLLRNYIFLRAARRSESQEALYEKYWRRFDDEFWRQEVRQGRLNRPRSDLFMQHFLVSRQLADIPIKHLFVEYKFWIERESPFATVEQELIVLSRQREHFRRIVQPEKGDVVFNLATFLGRFEISTAYPFLLFLFDVGLSESDWVRVSAVLESYFLRRAVLGWTTKAYNRILLNLIKTLRTSGPTPDNLVAALSELSGETAAWPTDAEFSAGWRDAPAYNNLNNAKLVHILTRLSNSYLSNKNEEITIDCPLSVEHILPQDWVENWPLPTGEKGLTWQELWDVQSDDPRAISTKQRNALLQTLGNLTILTQALNSSVSNSAWLVKKPELLKSSLLPINQDLHGTDAWGEEAIQQRGKRLFERAAKLWPSPSSVPA